MSANIDLIKDIWHFILKKNKNFFFIVLFLINLNSLLEVLTLSLIVPFIMNILSSKNIEQNFFLEKIYSIFESSFISNYSLFITMLFVFIFFLTTCSRILFLFYSNIFNKKLGEFIGSKIFYNYLKSPYSRIVRRNSSDALSLIADKTERINFLIYNFINIINSFFILLSLVIGLIFITNYNVLFVILFFALFYSLINLFTIKKVQKYSEVISKNIFLKYKSVSESLLTIREVILNNAFKLFLDRFEKSDKNYRRAQMRVGIISSFPKIIIEFLGIIFVCILSYYFINKNETDSTILISYLGALVFALYRMLPLINNLYSSFVQILSAKESSLEVLSELKNQPFFHDDNYFLEKSNFESISFKNVYFKHQNTADYVLENINVFLKNNHIYGIFGKTGVGKSTFLDLLSGLLKPTQGEILINNRVLQDNNIRNWQNNISIVSQNIFLLDDSIKKNIEFSYMNENSKTNNIKEACKEAEIYDFIESLPDKYETVIGENGIRLSGGQRQRIGIARALFKNSKVLILDESTNSLDSETEKNIFERLLILKNKITIIIVTHKLATLKYCDKIFEIKKKQISENLLYN
jgi:ATP-binding cassette subfamily B protein